MTTTEKDCNKKRSWFSRVLRYWLKPIYYFLNLYEPKGQPSLSRIMLLGGFIHALVTLSIITFKVFNSVPEGQFRPAVSVAYIFLSALVYSLIFGYRGYRTWLDSKGTGLADSLTAEVNKLPDVMKVEGDYAIRLMGAQKAPTYNEE